MAKRALPYTGRRAFALWSQLAAFHRGTGDRELYRSAVRWMRTSRLYANPESKQGFRALHSLGV